MRRRFASVKGRSKSCSNWASKPPWAARWSAGTPVAAVVKSRSALRMTAPRVTTRGTFHDVFQLSHVSGPVVFGQLPDGILAEALGVDSQTLCMFAHEVVSQQSHVFLALSEAGDVDGDHIEAVEEVFTELLLLDLLGQIRVGGRNDAHIETSWSRPRRHVGPHHSAGLVGAWLVQAKEGHRPRPKTVCPCELAGRGQGACVSPR